MKKVPEKNQSRKASQSSRRSREESLGIVDDALNCCRNITTIAELLAASGLHEALKPEQLTHAGEMIAKETQKLQGLIRSLDEPGK